MYRLYDGLIDSTNESRFSIAGGNQTAGNTDYTALTDYFTINNNG